MKNEKKARKFADEIMKLAKKYGIKIKFSSVQINDDVLIVFGFRDLELERKLKNRWK